MNIELFGNIIGIIGMILIVVAYGLTQTEKIKPSDLMFTHINISGSICLVISLLIDFNLASFILEIVWISISLYGYFRYFTKNGIRKDI